VGYGDVHPVRDQGWAQAMVITEVGVGLYFLAALFATMVSWASAVPALPSLEQLQAECPWTPNEGAAQQAAAPHRRAGAPSRASRQSDRKATKNSARCGARGTGGAPHQR
jgi:hypothetical protein